MIRSQKLIFDIENEVVNKEFLKESLKDHENHRSQKVVTENERRSKFTFAQDTKGYMIWNIVIIFNGIYSCLVYPAYTLNGFPSQDQFNFWLICFSEALFFIDICLSFFKQELNEEGQSKQESLE